MNNSFIYLTIQPFIFMAFYMQKRISNKNNKSIIFHHKTLSKIISSALIIYIELVEHHGSRFLMLLLSGIRIRHA